MSAPSERVRLTDLIDGMSFDRRFRHRRRRLRSSQSDELRLCTRLCARTIDMLIVPATDGCAEFNKDATAPDPAKEPTPSTSAAKRSSIRGQPPKGDSLRWTLPQVMRNGATTPQNRS